MTDQSRVERGLADLAAPVHPSSDALETIRRRGRRSRRRRVGVAGVSLAALATAAALLVATLANGSSHPTRVQTITPSVPTTAVPAPSAPTTASAPRTSAGGGRVTIPPTTAAPGVLPAGAVGSKSQIPWSDVGAGWTLASWVDAAPTGSLPAAQLPSTLFLVDPLGGRYVIETVATNALLSPMALEGWSGDGAHALFAGTSGIAVLDLHTGQVSAFAPAGYKDGALVTFTEPDGTALLMAEQDTTGNGPGILERYSLTGQLQFAYPSTYPQGGQYEQWESDSPDGTELAVQAANGIELVANGGTGIRLLPDPAGESKCTPVHWLGTGGQLLGQCVPSDAVPQLWVFPADGGAPRALTATPTVSPDAGDMDAWQLPSGTFVEDAVGCSSTYLARLEPNGTTVPVTGLGPTSQGTVDVIGVYGDDVEVDRIPGGCGGFGSLEVFDAATGAITPILGGSAAGGGSTTQAVLFDNESAFPD